MKTWILCLCLISPFSLIAQEKGVSPIFSPSEGGQEGSTYAVVVGISDYQDGGIPDLRFADRDAEAFANFLRSPAGGGLDKDHLKILTNERATAAQVAIALDWLIDICGKGDRVIIYFSGHGDVESKRLSQPGYLLGWDAPSKVYMAGGAINVRDLQDIISTLSVENRAKVILITDACRSGKLSGSEVGGAQLTSQNLAQQFENEIKILSCQPNEYSIEGEQWGGGRGAFSYHLIDGLYGMADGNGDLAVNLMEIGRYLQDKVTTEVNPQSQVPMTVGNFTENLVSVDPDLLEQLRQGKKGELQLFTPTESRSREEQVLAGVDSTVQDLYAAFEKTLKDKQFLAPPNDCADFYFEQLMVEPLLEPLHASIRRNYAAALQDDAQQELNTMLKLSLSVPDMKGIDPKEYYGKYPQYLERAADILGEGHYMYARLQARKYYFEAKLSRKNEDLLNSYRKALAWQPDMAHAMVDMSYKLEPDQADSAAYYFQKAREIVPSWERPYLNYAARFFMDYDKAEALLKEAESLDTASVSTAYVKGVFYALHGKWGTAEKYYQKAIEGSGNDICFPCAHLRLGTLYEETERYAEAEQQFKKAYQIEPGFYQAYSSLGDLYIKTGRSEQGDQLFKNVAELDPNNAGLRSDIGWTYLGYGRLAAAEKWFLEAIRLDSTIRYAHPNLGLVYAKTGRYDEAAPLFQKGLELNPENAMAVYANYALLFSLQNRIDEAFDYLQKAFESGFSIYNTDHLDLNEEPGLAALRAHKKRWKELIEKYFPDYKAD